MHIISKKQLTILMSLYIITLLKKRRGDIKMAVKTNPQEVYKNTKENINKGVIPNMLFKYSGRANSFVIENSQHT